MPITFDCSCGKKYRVKDEAAGRVFPCQDCGEKIEVPAADAIDLGIVTDDPPPALLATPPAAPVDSVATMTRAELGSLIAQAIAFDRRQVEAVRGRATGAGIFLALVAVVSVFGMAAPGGGGPGAICFVVAVTGMAILGHMP